MANHSRMNEFGDGQLVAFADSLWTAMTPIRFAGAWFPHVMTVVRLSDGSVLLHSPCKPTARLYDDLARLGDVAHVVAPNWFHDLYLAQYRAKYPNAIFWGPPLLRRLGGRRIIDRTISPTTQSQWSPEIPHIVLPGLLTFEECLFFHRKSQTLIIADFLTNLCVRRTTLTFTALAYRLSGVNGKLAAFPVLRWFDVMSRRRLRAAAEQLLGWHPRRIIVGHGTAIDHDAEPKLRSALGWILS